MDSEELTATMMAGFCASFAGTLMFISRPVGLVPKLVTRVSAPLTVATAALRPRKVLSRCILVRV